MAVKALDNLLARAPDATYRAPHAVGVEGWRAEEHLVPVACFHADGVVRDEPNLRVQTLRQLLLQHVRRRAWAEDLRHHVFVVGDGRAAVDDVEAKAAREVCVARGDPRVIVDRGSTAHRLALHHTVLVLRDDTPGVAQHRERIALSKQVSLAVGPSLDEQDLAFGRRPQHRADPRRGAGTRAHDDKVVEPT